MTRHSIAAKQSVVGVVLLKRVLPSIGKILNCLIDNVLLLALLLTAHLVLQIDDVSLGVQLLRTQVANIRALPTKQIIGTQDIAHALLCALHSLKTKVRAKLLGLLRVLECVLKASCLDALLLPHQISIGLRLSNTLTAAAERPALCKPSFGCLIGNVCLSLCLLLLDINNILHVWRHEGPHRAWVGRHIHVLTTSASLLRSYPSRLRSNAKRTLASLLCHLGSHPELPRHLQVRCIAKCLVLHRRKPSNIIARILAIRDEPFDSLNFASVFIYVKHLLHCAAESCLDLRLKPVRNV